MKIRLFGFFAIFAVLLGGFLAAFINFFILTPGVREQARHDAFSVMERSGEMFMMSTRQFSKAFEAAANDGEKADIRAKWIDTAIIHNLAKKK